MPQKSATAPAPDPAESRSQSHAPLPAASRSQSEPAAGRRTVGIPAFLIFLVFGLSGISIALFSFSFESIIDRYLGDQPLPAITIFLMEFPLSGWIGSFLLTGILVAWWFETMERRHGEVPRRTAGLVAIASLILVFFILTGLSLPFLDGMGASGAH